MRIGRSIWPWFMIVSVLSLVILLTGFAASIKTVIYPNGQGQEVEAVPDQEQAGINQEGLLLLGLGDSLTKGTGDELGEGYLNKLRSSLRASGQENVKLINLAVDGNQTVDLLEMLEQTVPQNTVRSANIITFTIGGNDLFRIGDEVRPETAREQMQPTLERIEAILQKLRALNSEALICYVGLYHPFTDLQNAAEIAHFVQEWNGEVAKLVAGQERVVFVPTYDLFQWNTASLLSSDHYHPNASGYQRVTDRLKQVITAYQETVEEMQ